MRVALERRASLKNVGTPPSGSSPQHFKLTTDVDKNEATSLGGQELVSFPSESVDPPQLSKPAALLKLEASVRSSLPEVAKSSPSSAEKEGEDDTPRVEKIGGNLPNMKKGVKPEAAALAKEESYDVDVHEQREEVDYDDDFEESEGSDAEHMAEALSDSEEEEESQDDGEEEEEEATYAPWNSLGSTPQTTNARVYSSPVHAQTTFGGMQSPGRRAISPLTKSIRSGDDLAHKSPSVSVDVGGKKEEEEKNVTGGLSPALSSSTDGKGLNITGGLSPALSSSTDGKGLKVAGGLSPALSSSTDGKGLKVAGGLSPALSSSTDGKGLNVTGGLSPALSSSTDGNGLKVAGGLSPALSSSTDGKGLNISGGLSPALSSATDGSKMAVGLKSSLSSPADVNLLKVSTCSGYTACPLIILCCLPPPLSLVKETELTLSLKPATSLSTPSMKRYRTSTARTLTTWSLSWPTCRRTHPPLKPSPLRHPSR